MVILTSVNLKESVDDAKEEDLVRPLSFHERTEHTLPEDKNPLMPYIKSLQEYADSHSMKINTKKTKVTLFNPLKKFDTLPKISLSEDDPVEVVEEYKLLGQIIRSDMKTISNTEHICRKGYQRLWIVRRLKELGCDMTDLLDVLRQQVVSVLEQAVPYWGPLITRKESNMIERVLKTGLQIILQEKYKSFKNALHVTIGP